MSIKNIKINEKVTNIVLNILIFIFGLILLITLYNGIQVKILNKPYADFFGYSVFEVQTGSMAKAINAGDWIIVKKTNNIELNDVVTYKNNDDFITHRVIESYKGTYVTKGDANNAKDAAITDDMIVGKVVKVLHYFGIIRKTILNPIILITLIITIYAISFIFKDKNSPKTAFELKIQELINKLRKDKVSKEVIKEEEVVKEDSINKEEVVVKEEINNEVREDTITSINLTPHDESYNMEEIKNEVESSEDDLDKTLYFRVVPVDKTEIGDTYLEIAETNVVEEEPKKIDDEEIDLDDDTLIENNLELLQAKKNKRCKNVMDKIFFIKNLEINEIVETINRGEKIQVNEPTIKEEFQKAYIDAKYYNFCGDINVEYNSRNMNSRIIKALENKGANLTKKYQGSDKKYGQKVNKYTKMFNVILTLERGNETVKDLKAKKELFNKKLEKFYAPEKLSEEAIDNLTKSVIKTQKIYRGMIEYFLKKMETNTFDLALNELSIKKQYGVDLAHNIAFSKVYSDYIVDKTYTEGIIAEDKITILFTLLSTKLIKDMFEANFKNRYVVYIPDSLYEKEFKLNKLLKLIEDEYAKTNIYILLKYNDLSKNQKLIKGLIKLGYHFALGIDKNTTIKVKDRASLYLMEQIYLNKKSVDTKMMLEQIPSDLHKKVSNEDIVNKVGNFGGE